MVAQIFNLEGVRGELRQIERQKLMIKPGRIVIHAEFDKCFGDDGDGTYLSSFKRRNYNAFLERMIRNESFYFGIPPGLVTAAEQGNFNNDKAALSSGIEELKSLKKEEERKRSPSARLLAGLNVMIANAGEELASIHVKAIFLDTLLQSWNETHSAGDALDRAGTALLARGEGQAMIDFWTAVDNLSDYSSLFPGRQPPGGKKEQNQNAAPAGGKPSF